MLKDRAESSRQPLGFFDDRLTAQQLSRIFTSTARGLTHACCALEFLRQQLRLLVAGTSEFTPSPRLRTTRYVRDIHSEKRAQIFSQRIRILQSEGSCW
jgi:hypothetical protein